MYIVAGILKSLFKTCPIKAIKPLSPTLPFKMPEMSLNAMFFRASIRENFRKKKQIRLTPESMDLGEMNKLIPVNNERQME
jgi:hypothetical protein